MLRRGARSDDDPQKAAFVDGLKQYGWVEGANLAIEWRYAEGHDERFPDLAGELVQVPVDAIVTFSSTPATQAAQRATTTIPIVFIDLGDPLPTGIVDSVARPGGNTTGLSNAVAASVARRLQLLAEVVPGLARVGYLMNPNNAANLASAKEMQQAGAALGIQIHEMRASSVSDFEPAFAAAVRERAQAVVTSGGNPNGDNYGRIAELALAARLPTMGTQGEMTAAGGLMAYGRNVPDLYRRAGSYIEKILRGTRVIDLPVEQPTRFDLVINQRTADRLAVAIPRSVADQATEWIR